MHRRIAAKRGRLVPVVVRQSFSRFDPDRECYEALSSYAPEAFGEGDSIEEAVDDFAERLA